MKTLAEKSSPPRPPVLCTSRFFLAPSLCPFLFAFVRVNSRFQKNVDSPLPLFSHVQRSPTSHFFSSKTPAIPAFPPNPTSLFSVPLLILHFEFSTLNFFTSHQNVDSFGLFAPSSAKFKIPNLKSKIGLSLQKNNSTFCPLRALGLSRPISLCLRASVVNAPTSHLFSPKTPAIPAFPSNPIWLSLQKNNFHPPFQENVDSTLAGLGSLTFTFQHSAHPASGPAICILHSPLSIRN
jgi:hypothetical protein